MNLGKMYLCILILGLCAFFLCQIIVTVPPDEYMEPDYVVIDLSEIF